jgi:hypothetical protein
MYWLVDSIVEKGSTLMPNATVYHITFVNIETRQQRKTYVECSFKNYSNWQTVIQNYPQGQIVSNLILWGKDKINADSCPQIEFVLDRQQMQQLVEERWHLHQTKI